MIWFQQYFAISVWSQEMFSVNLHFSSYLLIFFFFLQTNGVSVSFWEGKWGGWLILSQCLFGQSYLWASKLPNLISLRNWTFIFNFQATYGLGPFNVLFILTNPTWSFVLQPWPAKILRCSWFDYYELQLNLVHFAERQKYSK